MKTKFFLSCSLVVLFLTILFFQGVAFAAVQRTPLRLRIAPQGLNIAAPATVDMGSIPVDVSDNQLEFFTDIEVADLRGNPTPLGWSATLTASEFIDAANRNLKIGFSNMQLLPPTAAELPPGRSSHFRVIGGDSNVTHFNAPTRFQDTDRDGTSDPVPLMNAAQGRGVGQYAVTVKLQLNVPAFTPAGNYEAVLTSTVS